MLKRLVYNRQLITDKYREAKNISGVSYNKKMTKEKSEEGNKV
jgi:hypothetical protein